MRPGWVAALLVVGGSSAIHAEPRDVPDVGIALIAGSVGQDRTAVGGQGELGWTTGRLGVAIEGSLLAVNSDNDSVGRSAWLGACGRVAILDATSTRTIASGARELVWSSLLAELVVQREWWNIIEHAQPPPVGPDRYTLGLGLAGRIRIVDERAPNLVIGTRMFARALLSETPVPTDSSGVHYARDYGFVLGIAVDVGHTDGALAPRTRATIASAH